MALVLKNLPANAGDIGKKWHPAPVFLPGKFHEQRSLAGYSSWGCKQLDMLERLNHTIVKNKENPV